MPRAHRRKKRRFVPALLRGLLITAACALAAALAALAWYLDFPSWEKLDLDRIRNMDQTLHVYDREDEAVAAVYSLQNRTVVSLSEISPYVISAVLAVEDTRFYSHHGVDFIRIAGALISDIRAGDLSEGASTITQQLIKNTHLTTEKTWKRKAQEAWLAWQLENALSKDEILELYLNFNYFGGGAYGIEAAARRYFGKPASDLTLSESALLAGVLKGTGVYAPHINLALSIERRNVVLDVMAEAGSITARQAAEAKKDPVNLVSGASESRAADSYVDAAVEEAAALLGVDYDALVTSGYRIYTYLDTGVQEEAAALMRDDSLFPEPAGDKRVEAAVTLLDSHTGGAVALIGGRGYTTRGFNRATDAARQPGSAIKPVLVYAPAIEYFGYTAATLLLDEPVDYSGYSPRNFSGTYSGTVTLREALVDSLNVPAVRVLHDIGLSAAMDYAERSGITFSDKDRNLAIALGGLTDGVSPLDLARSYLPLSNGGFVLEPTLIRRIETADGELVYAHKADPVRVLSPETGFILSDILRDAALEGTGRRLAETDIPLAAKTGTVSDGGDGVRDAWIAVYNPEYVLTVWMGYDYALSMPSDATGGNYPAAIASRIFTALYEGQTPPSFVQPSGVVQAALDRYTLEEEGKLRLASDLTPSAWRLYEYFTLATVPTALTEYWALPRTPDDLKAWIDGDDISLSFTAPDAFASYLIQKKGPDDEGFYTVAAVERPGGRVQWTDVSVSAGVNRYRVVPIHPGIIQNGSPLEGNPTGVAAIEIEEKNPFPFMFPWFNWGNGTAATTPVPAETAAAPVPSPTPGAGRTAA